MAPTTEFDSIAFLSIGEETLSLGRVLQYLQLSGKLLPLLRELVEEHLIVREIQTRPDLDVSLVDLEQLVIDFRLQQQLTDSDRFQSWLASQGMDYALLQNRVLLGLKLNQLVEKVAEPNLQSVFDQQREQLAQVDLSCFISADKEQAEQVRQQLISGVVTLEQLGQTCDRTTTMTLQGPIRWGQIAADLRQVIAAAPPGEWVGPVSLGTRWCVFQLGQRTEAVLEGDLMRQLQRQLFQQWLDEQVKTLPIRLAGSPH